MLLIPLDLPPMEAKLVVRLPPDDGWWFEPKWDGFRCLAFKDGGEVVLMSKAGKPLTRYFPEVADAIAALPVRQVVLDGELTIAVAGQMAFDALQARLHPAPSRIAKLSVETPAEYVVFDCLAEPAVSRLTDPLVVRRESLLRLSRGWPDPGRLRLSPGTIRRATAQTWLERSGGALDGVVAKRLDGPYAAGERAMLKVKLLRSADCVVGGFRRQAAGPGVASLLLGLYDDAGLLNHVGFTSMITNAERDTLTRRLETLVGPPGFTGKAPGVQSRWATDRSAAWIPLRPELVVEVSYDQVTGGRFRHGVRRLRWRPDKSPRQCRMDQLQPELAPAQVIGVIA